MNLVNRQNESLRSIMLAENLLFRISSGMHAHATVLAFLNYVLVILFFVILGDEVGAKLTKLWRLWLANMKGL